MMALMMEKVILKKLNQKLNKTRGQNKNNEMPTPNKINCLFFIHLRKSSRTFMVGNYVLN
jgi:hypothetical protein